jgi:hypothetical protein
MSTTTAKQNKAPDAAVKENINGILGLVFLASIVYLAGLFGLFEPSKPASINEISGNIISVNEISKDGNKIFKIDYKMDFFSDDADIMFMVSNDIRDDLQKINENFPDLQDSKIEFALVAKLQDQYGNTSDQPVMLLSWDMADIKKINFTGNNFTGWNLLSLANPVEFLHPVGKKIIYAYCQDPKTVEYTGNFCMTSIISSVIDSK